MFFKSELEDTKKRVEEKGHQKLKRPETGHVSPLCRFCKMQLKRGSNSPHIDMSYTYIHMCKPHTGFPGVAGKYIHCPDKVFFIYQPQNVQKDDLERV